MKQSTEQTLINFAALAVVIGGLTGIAKCTGPEIPPTASERQICEQAVYRNNVDRAEDPETILIYPDLTFDQCIYSLRKPVVTPKPGE